MKLGITGLAGAGKSTVFGALTQTEVDEARKVEDRIGTIKVPDGRIDILSDMYKPKKTIFAQVEYFLPALAGRGKENKEQSPWNAVRDCDALIHVVRNFRGYGIDAAAPVNDFIALDQELILADLVVAEKRLERLVLDKQRGRNFDPEEQSLLIQCHDNLEKELALRHFPELSSARQLRGFAFLSAKPMLVLFNNGDENDSLPELADPVSREICAVIRGKLELELSAMSTADAEEFLVEFQITASAMDRVVKQSYDLQGLISFFTVGEDEVRAWTIKSDTQAVEAAGAVHSDIQKGFIRAEVVSYEDLMAAGTYAEARKRGTVRLEGKTYIVQDGDIINYRFNV